MVTLPVALIAEGKQIQPLFIFSCPFQGVMHQVVPTGITGGAKTLWFVRWYSSEICNSTATAFYFSLWHMLSSSSVLLLNFSYMYIPCTLLLFLCLEAAKNVAE
jgi:hypothetical protein